MQIFLLLVLRILEIEKQVLSKIQYCGANVACCADIGIVSKGKHSGPTDLGFKGQECQWPEQFRVLVLRPRPSTSASKTMYEYYVYLVTILRSVDNV